MGMSVVRQVGSRHDIGRYGVAMVVATPAMEGGRLTGSFVLPSMKVAG